MSTTTVHCISCGAETTGTDGKAQCPSCGQDFEYAIVARVQDVIPYQSVGQAVVPRKRDAYCQAALYLSLISCAFPLIAATSIALAIAGLFKVRRNGKRGVDYAVIAIVFSIIGGMVFFGMWDGVRGAGASSLNIACQSNLREIGIRIMMYENDHPSAQGYGHSDIYAASPPTSKSTFQCPNVDDPIPVPATGGIPTSYVLLTSLQPFRRVADPDTTVIAFETSPHHIPAGDGFPEANGHNVLFADGHIGRIPLQDLPAVIEKSLLTPRRLRTPTAPRPQLEPKTEAE